MTIGASLGGTIAARSDRLLDRLADAARRTRRGSDAESIHDTRVAIRRLEAALDLWRDALRPSRRRRAKQALRALRRRIGPAREAEVSAEVLRARMADVSPEAAVAATFVLDRIERRVRRLRGRAAQVCVRGRIERIARRVRRAWRTFPVDPVPTAPLVADARSRLEGHATASRSALASALRSADPEELHGARIAIKRWRYAQECVAETAPDPDPTDHGWMKEAQDSLGRLNDLAVVCRSLARWEHAMSATNPRAGAPLKELIERLAAERRGELARLARFVAGVDRLRMPLALPARKPGSAAASDR